LNLKDIQNYFKFIIEATNELMYKFKEMAEDGLTPYNFGLAVRQDPNSQLQITAKNKMKNAEEKCISLDLSGKLIETVRFAKNPQLHDNNLNILKEISYLKLIFYQMNLLQVRSPFFQEEQKLVHHL